VRGERIWAFSESERILRCEKGSDAMPIEKREVIVTGAKNKVLSSPSSPATLRRDNAEEETLKLILHEKTVLRRGKDDSA